MGVDRKILAEGNGKDFPKAGDNVTIEYTGNLHDAEVKPHAQGKQFVPHMCPIGKAAKAHRNVSCRFDSSVGRGDFQTQIGVGKVIKGILEFP